MRFALQALASLLLLYAFTLLASAQATRTWVSGVGDDANPCSRTAPCKTFAGAISKTAAGGEISALDPGGFGAVTITKAITINGDGDLAGILVAGTNGITIAAGASDVVILRSLSIAGVNSGLDGVRLNSAAQLVIENSTIYGFTQNGVNVNLSQSGNVVLNNVSITGNTAATGLHVNGSSGTVNVTVNKCSFTGLATGVDALYGSTDIQNSVISQNSSYGVLAEGGSVTLESNLLAGNGVAAQAQTGATVRLSNNDVFDNGTGFGCGGGTLASAGNNKKGGNVGGGTACAPNATVAVQ